VIGERGSGRPRSTTAYGYAVESRTGDLFQPWREVSRWKTWDDAYADLMERRDNGHTVRVVEHG